MKRVAKAAPVIKRPAKPARIIKPGVVRREEILDAAQTLFADEGYDTTSVGRIIERVGLSKGAFYHHFVSKDALLAALVARMTDAGLAAITEVVGDDALSPLQKLDAFFAAAHAIKSAHASTVVAAARAMAAPANLPLRKALARRAIAGAAPLLLRVLAEGRARGDFDCEPSLAWATFILASVATYQDELLDALYEGTLSDSDLDARLAILGEAVARLVGARAHPTPAPAALARKLVGRKTRR